MTNEQTISKKKSSIMKRLVEWVNEDDTRYKMMMPFIGIWWVAMAFLSIAASWMLFVLTIKVCSWFWFLCMGQA